MMWIVGIAVGLVVGAVLGDAMAGLAVGAAWVATTNHLALQIAQQRLRALRTELDALDERTSEARLGAAWDALGRRIEALEGRDGAGAPPAGATSTPEAAPAADTPTAVAPAPTDAVPTPTPTEPPSAAEAPTPPESPPQAMPDPTPAPPQGADTPPDPREDLEATLAAARARSPGQASPPEAPSTGAVAPPPVAGPDAAEPEAHEGSLESQIRGLIVGGNPLARVGAVVLLVGVALLLQQAIQRQMFPVELRLMGSALLGAGLAGLGARLRTTRRDLSWMLQGAGSATLYLTVFFAYQVYALLPAGLALALLVVVSGALGVAAVVQRAQPLALVAVTAAYAAPLAASSGSGDHVSLFSYQLVLGMLLVAVSWYVSWSLLTVVGFVFTLGIGVSWGLFDYAPDDFATTEPFVLACFVVYLAADLVAALRRPRLGQVSSSLTFGLPVALLTVQAALTEGDRVWMTGTAVGLAALYVGLGAALRRRGVKGMVVRIEAYLALAIAAGTLAVPFAVESTAVIGVAWVLEAVALYWLGLRQARPLARAVAPMLWVVGVITSLLDGVLLDSLADGPFLLHAAVLNTTVILASAVWLDWRVHQDPEAVSVVERPLWGALMVPAFGLCWFAVVPDLGVLIDDPSPWAWGAWSAVVSLGLAGVGAVLQRTPTRLLPAVGVAPLALVLLFDLWESRPHTLEDPVGVAVSWAAAVGFAAVWARCAPQAVGQLVWWAVGTWSVVLSMLLAGDVVYTGLTLGPSWAAAAVGVVLAGLLVCLSTLTDRGGLAWAPERTGALKALGVTTGLVSVAAWLMSLYLPGDADPLPYLPLLNPVELATGALFVVAAWRLVRDREGAQTGLVGLSWGLGLALFVSLHAAVARATHAYTAVAYSPDDMLADSTFQAAVSGLWAVVGLGLTVGSSRRGHRTGWGLGFGLLGLLVAKLFLFDLAQLDTLVSAGLFLVVGALLLAVAYLAPRPPDALDETPEESP